MTDDKKKRAAAEGELVTHDLQEKVLRSASIVSLESLHIGAEPVDIVTLRGGQIVAITTDAIYAYEARKAFEDGVPLGAVDT